VPGWGFGACLCLSPETHSAAPIADQPRRSTTPCQTQGTTLHSVMGCGFTPTYDDFRKMWGERTKGRLRDLDVRGPRG
jgi:hypothetical protein